MCILKNIKKEAKLNVKRRCRSFSKQELEQGEIFSKFYPIYNNFYKSIFKYELANTEYQRCIVHQVRNTLKHVLYKDKKLCTKDLKSIYNAESEERAHEIMLDVKEKWEKQYSNSMKNWVDNWDAICPIFKFSSNIRKIIYTTNAI